LGEDGRYGDPAEQLFLHSGCNLYLQREGQEKVPLIASNSDVVKNVVPSQVSFRIIPFDSENNYFSAAETTLHLNDVAKPGVWVFLHLYSPFYQPLGQNQIDQPLQLFFNLNAPLPSTLTL
jgi:hypothetical protein